MLKLITREKLIIDWFKRSQKQRTKNFGIFDQFISLWFAFNSWGTFVTKSDADWLMIRKLKTDRALLSSFGSLLSNEDFRADVERLAEYSVLDMRPGHEHEQINISNPEDFGQVLDTIYKIRCNLFHGQKSEINPHDRELVTLSFRILSDVFKPIIDNIGKR